MKNTGLKNTYLVPVSVLKCFQPRKWEKVVVNEIFLVWEDSFIVWDNLIAIMGLFEIEDNSNHCSVKPQFLVMNAAHCSTITFLALEDELIVNIITSLTLWITECLLCQTFNNSLRLLSETTLRDF